MDEHSAIKNYFPSSVEPTPFFLTDELYHSGWKPVLIHWQFFCILQSLYYICILHWKVTFFPFYMWNFNTILTYTFLLITLSWKRINNHYIYVYMLLFFFHDVLENLVLAKLHLIWKGTSLIILVQISTKGYAGSGT